MIYTLSDKCYEIEYEIAKYEEDSVFEELKNETRILIKEIEKYKLQINNRNSEYWMSGWIPTEEPDNRRSQIVWWLDIKNKYVEKKREIEEYKERKKREEYELWEEDEVKIKEVLEENYDKRELSEVIERVERYMEEMGELRDRRSMLWKSNRIPRLEVLKGEYGLIMRDMYKELIYREYEKRYEKEKREKEEKERRKKEEEEKRKFLIEEGKRKKRAEGEEEFLRGMRIRNVSLSRQIDRELLKEESERNENIMRMYILLKQEYVKNYEKGIDLYDE